MIPLYNPATGLTVATQGQQGVSVEILNLNILIELRVANLLAIELAKGNTNLTLEGLRLEVTSDVLPATV